MLAGSACCAMLSHAGFANACAVMLTKLVLQKAHSHLRGLIFGFSGAQLYRVLSGVIFGYRASQVHRHFKGDGNGLYSSGKGAIQISGEQGDGLQAAAKGTYTFHSASCQLQHEQFCNGIFVMAVLGSRPLNSICRGLCLGRVKLQKGSLQCTVARAVTARPPVAQFWWKPFDNLNLIGLSI